MSETYGGLVLVGLALVAFLPPVLYLVWLRALERHGREPWIPLAKAFLWGAVPAVFLAAFLEILIVGTYFADPALAASAFAVSLFSGVVVAPAVEEAVKGLGLRWVRDEHPEPEDGLVYGAAVGLGFAAMENLFYIGDALVFQGLPVAVSTAFLRIVSSAPLHAAASAAVGYGVWSARYGRRGTGAILGGYGAAVLMHAGFNFLATLQLAAPLVFAIVLAIVLFARLRRYISELDAATARPGP